MIKGLFPVITLLVLFASLFAVAVPGRAVAECADGDTECIENVEIPQECKNSLLGIPRWYEYLEIGNKPNTNDPCAIIGPTVDGEFDWGRAVPRVLVAVTEILLRVAAILAVGYTIYGGFRYILSQGEPEATKKAKGTIIGASVGLVITIFAAAIVGLIGSTLWQ